MMKVMILIDTEKKKRRRVNKRDKNERKSRV
jgi:hypothetical protein